VITDFDNQAAWQELAVKTEFLEQVSEITSRFMLHSILVLHTHITSTVPVFFNCRTDPHVVGSIIIHYTVVKSFTPWLTVWQCRRNSLCCFHFIFTNWLAVLSKVFHFQLILYLLIWIHVLSRSGSSIIFTKCKAKEHFAQLPFHFIFYKNLLKQKLHVFWRAITVHHFGIVNCLLPGSLLVHKFVYVPYYYCYLAAALLLLLLLCCYCCCYYYYYYYYYYY